ncbi:MAG: chromate transporter, partial [Betaproteobacteria bacterium]
MPNAPTPAIPCAPHRPRSKTDLFVSFTLLALQGFGGVLAVVQRELVEKKRWTTQAQFVEDWARVNLFSRKYLGGSFAAGV